MTQHAVRYENENGIGVIIIDNPPLNVLSQAVREGLISALEQADADKNAVALVLTGAGKTFPAGADISEFDSFNGPDINEIAARLDQLQKPVTAALHGTVLGGGLELALACHYRVADCKTKLGLPEVKLGLLPGGGGTQRLPRLTGIKTALDMIVSGEHISAASAQQAGLIDHIVEGDLIKHTLSFVQNRIKAKTYTRTRDQTDKLQADGDSVFFDRKREEIKKAKPHQHAPLRCIDAVENAIKLSFDEGVIQEQRLFEEALQDNQSKALIHAFFAERETAKIPNLGRNIAPRSITKVGIIGSGTMGGGIAMCFANADIPVIILDRDRSALDHGLAIIGKNYQSMVKRGRIDQSTMDQKLALIQSATDYDVLSDVDLVIEAVFEDFAVKQQVFLELDRVCKKGAILATNTSTLDIDRIAAYTSRPSDVVGMHFFSPANMMKLLEVIRGKDSAPDVIVTAMSIGRKIGKVCVLSGNCEGFIGNRMLGKYMTEALTIVRDGVKPFDVDQALTRFGMAMGPFAMSDLAGIDVSYKIRQKHLSDGDDNGTELLKRLYDAGRLGQKTGKGFYRYEAGNRTPQIDGEADQIIAQYQAQTVKEHTHISEQEIVNRLIDALVNEGANILNEGIAMRAGDIDIVYIYGYGFPAWRGGPMKYAELKGLAEVFSEIEIFHSRFEKSWSTSPLLKNLITENKSYWPR